MRTSPRPPSSTDRAASRNDPRRRRAARAGRDPPRHPSRLRLTGVGSRAGSPTSAASWRSSPATRRALRRTLRAAQREYDEHESQADGRGRRRPAGDPPGQGRRPRPGSARPSAAGDRSVEAAARAWLTRSTGSTARPATRRPSAAASARPRRLVGATLSASRSRPTPPGSAPRPPRAPASWRGRPSPTARKRSAGGADRQPLVPSGESTGEGDDEPLAAALGSGGTPRIFRLVRGDRAAMTELVDALAGDDGDARRRWQGWLAGTRRCDPGRRHRGLGPRLPRRPPVLGRRSRSARTATSPARWPRSAIGSTAGAAGSTSGSRPSATCRSRWATPGSTRCASGTGRPRPR